jgi:hypothetical protein
MEAIIVYGLVLLFFILLLALVCFVVLPGENETISQVSGQQIEAVAQDNALNYILAGVLFFFVVVVTFVTRREQRSVSNTH